VTSAVGQARISGLWQGMRSLEWNYGFHPPRSLSCIGREDFQLRGWLTEYKERQRLLSRDARLGCWNYLEAFLSAVRIFEKCFLNPGRCRQSHATTRRLDSFRRLNYRHLRGKCVTNNWVAAFDLLRRILISADNCMKLTIQKVFNNVFLKWFLFYKISLKQKINFNKYLFE